MKRKVIVGAPSSMIVFLLLHTFFASASAAAWQPAKGQLMTRWAKDVSPKNAHPEYPRPQMVRKDWLNLNGVWKIAMGEESIRKDILVPFPPESALSGVMQHSDRLTYWKT